MYKNGTRPARLSASRLRGRAGTRGWRGPLRRGLDECSFSVLRTTLGPRDLAMAVAAAGRTSGIGSYVADVGVGVDAADLDSPLAVRVEQLPLQRPGSLGRGAHRRQWRCTHCSMTSCSALAPLHSATNPTFGDVDVAWFQGGQGIHHRPRMTVARGSSLMLRTRALTHTREDGHTIFGMALRFDLNPTRELANTFLTALARSAQCTGFYACILDALLCGGAMTIPTIMLCTATISRCAPTASVRYTQNLKLVSLSFSPREHAHCTPQTLASTHVCFERLTTEVENTTPPPIVRHHRTAVCAHTVDRLLQREPPGSPNPNNRVTLSQH
jgi:hypothetical protein